ncbi:MAG TPA: hypothetical protein DEQ40_08415 [Oxalobacteraceae bacterium]|nr:hypothetical protein [Oxalobacteraceae bacterium]
MRYVAIFAAALVLAGCAAPEPIIKTQVVNVAVAVHCMPDLGPGPSWKDDSGAVHQGYPDTAENLEKAPNIFVRVKYLLAGRALRIQQEKVLTAAVEGCE